MRKVRQVCDGGLRCRNMYLPMLVSLMSMSSLSNSPWMWARPREGSRGAGARSDREPHGKGRSGRTSRSVLSTSRRGESPCDAIQSSLRFDDGQCRAPVAPDSAQNHPQEPVDGFQARTFLRDSCKTRIWCRSAKISSSKAARDRSTDRTAASKGRIRSIKKALRGGDQLS